VGYRFVGALVASVALVAASSARLVAASSARAAIQPVQYFGGPVMPSEQVVLVEWGPNVSPTFTASTNGDPGFFGYLESQGGTTTDIGGVLAQYGDKVSGVAGNASNAPTYAGEIEITPTKGSGSTAATVTDSDIQAQLQSSIAAGTLPSPLAGGLGTMYVILFPPRDTIVDPSGATSVTGFCAYHNTGGSLAAPVVYAVIPNTNNSFNPGGGCGAEPSAIQNETSTVSHEYVETVTDPEIGFDTSTVYANPVAWASNAPNEGEIADICDTGRLSENAANGTWTVQTTWSNLDSGCEATEPKYSTPTAVITPPSNAIAGTAAGFSADTSSDPPANKISTNHGLVLLAPLGPGIVSYDWNWGDGTQDSTGADPSHAFAQAGHDTVTLTVTDAIGFTATTTDGVTVTNPASPAVATSAATSISDTGATLNGTINPWGHATTYQFDYGTSPSNLSSTTTVSGAGSTPAVEPEAATVTGLTPGTTYYFELVGTYGGGSTVDGGVQTFTTTGTPPAPPAPVPATVAASAIGTTGARLNGTIDPDGLIVTYDFAWGTSPSALTNTTPTPAAAGPVGNTSQRVVAPLGGLAPGRTYYYRLDVQYDGQTYSGDVLSFTTQATPAAVLLAAPTAITASSATLEGAVDPDGFATSYHFEFGTTAAYGQSSAVVSAGAGTASESVAAPIGGLAPGTTYHYRLVATSAGGTVASVENTFTTLAPPPPAPVLGFTIPAGQSLRSALRQGIAVKFTCNIACSVSFAVRRAPRSSADVARAPVELATGTARLAHAGSGTATLRLSRAGHRVFKHAAKLALVIDGAAENVAGVAGRPVTHRLRLS
jgi:hypothetical protein